MATVQTYLSYDVNQEHILRNWGKFIGQQLQLAGFSQTLDHGQIFWDSPMVSCSGASTPYSTNATSNGNVYNLFDSNNSTFWQTIGAPTSINPCSFTYDCGLTAPNGSNITKKLTNYSIYYTNQNTDPMAWVVEGSNDNSTWYLVDTQTNQIAGIVCGGLVTNGGSGYTSAPTVVFSSGSAAATAFLDGGKLLSIHVDNIGSGYTSAPIISFYGGGQAAATANFSAGTINTITVDAGGDHYNDLPTIVITDPTGSGATATPVMTPGPVSFISVTAAGSAYTSAPVVIFTGGGGSGAIATAYLNSSGGVAGIVMVNGGSGYTSPPSISFTGGGGSGATAVARIRASINTINVSNGGSGYTAPVVSFYGGSGYTAPVVSFYGGGQATASSVIVGNAVVSIGITNPGFVYTSAPTVVISGGGGTGATATAFVSETYVANYLQITNSGSGYSSTAPTISFTGGGGTGAAATAYVVTTGWQNYPVPITKQSNYRYYRWTFTANQGSGSFMNLYGTKLFERSYALTSDFSSSVQNYAYRPNNPNVNNTNVMVGYEMYQFADSLSGSAPYYIKITYGYAYGSQSSYSFNGNNGNFVQAGPAFQIQLGTATDGNGNLIGSQTTATSTCYFGPTSNSFTSALQRCVCSYDAVNKNRFTMSLFYNSGLCSQTLIIERLKDNTGTDTANGVVALGWSPSSVWQMVMPATGLVPPTETAWGCVAPTSTSGIRGTTISVFTIKPFIWGEQNPITGAFAYFDADLTPEVPVGINFYGVQHTIFPISNFYPVARGNNSTRLAILWE